MQIPGLLNFITMTPSFHTFFHCVIVILVYANAVNSHNYNNRTARSAIGCSESIPTAGVVSSCPRTAEEWRIRSKKKNCLQFKHTCTSFEYHCVVNTWMNETVEVCAPKMNIVGKNCAEFNFGGGLIQRHSKMHCKECPAMFKSVKSFLYQECYEYVVKYRRSQILTTSLVTADFPSSIYLSKTSNFFRSTRKPYEKDPVDTKSERSLFLGVSGAAGVLSVLVLVLCAVYIRLRHKKRITFKADHPTTTGKSYAVVGQHNKLPTEEKGKQSSSENCKLLSH